MTSEIAYRKKIAEYAHDDLLRLWQAIQDRKSIDLGWDEGKAFEYLVVRAFELEGADIRYPYISNENGVSEQIDGIVYAYEFICILELKDWIQDVDFEPIAKLSSLLRRRPANIIGLFFSSSDFTPVAKLLTQLELPTTILLWSKTDVDFALRNRYFIKGLIAKFRGCVEARLVYRTLDWANLGGEG